MSEVGIRGWYHCTGHTYGTRLPGDPCYWRTRKHREDVPFDAEHPAGSEYGARLHARSTRLMKRPPVNLTIPEQRLVADAIRSKIDGFGIELRAIAVGRNHFRLLACFPFVCVDNEQNPGMAIPGLCAANALTDGRNPVPRHIIGVAKKHSSHVLRAHGFRHPGGVWATRSHIEPIEREAHLIEAQAYIRAHASEGAIVWPP